MEPDEIVEALESLSWDLLVIDQINTFQDYDSEEKRWESRARMHEDNHKTMLKLAQQLTSKDLDTLEAHEACDAAWILRIAPHVEGKKAQPRALRFLNHEDSEVRHQAQLIMAKNDFT